MSLVSHPVCKPPHKQSPEYPLHHSVLSRLRETRYKTTEAMAILIKYLERAHAICLTLKEDVYTYAHLDHELDYSPDQPPSCPKVLEAHKEIRGIGKGLLTFAIHDSDNTRPETIARSIQVIIASTQHFTYSEIITPFERVEEPDNVVMFFPEAQAA